MVKHQPAPPWNAKAGLMACCWLLPPTWPWNHRDIEGKKTEVSNPSDVYTLRAVHGVPMLIVHIYIYIYNIIYIHHYFLAGNMVYTPQIHSQSLSIRSWQCILAGANLIRLIQDDWRLLSWRVMVPWANTPKKASAFLAMIQFQAVSGCLLPTANPPLAGFGEVMIERFPQGEASNFSIAPLWGSTTWVHGDLNSGRVWPAPLSGDSGADHYQSSTEKSEDPTSQDPGGRASHRGWYTKSSTSPVVICGLDWVWLNNIETWDRDVTMKWQGVMMASIALCTSKGEKNRLQFSKVSELGSKNKEMEPT